MDRRVFIKLSAASAAAISLYLLDSCQTATVRKEMAMPDAFSHIVDKAALIETGKAYLEQQPSENDKNKLSSLLMGDRADITDPAAVTSFLLDKVEADFKSGDVVITKGWVLSKTEARQCALFSLLQN